MLEYHVTDTAVLVLQLKTNKQTNMQHALLNRTELNPALLEYLQLPSNFSPYLYGKEQMIYLVRIVTILLLGC